MAETIVAEATEVVVAEEPKTEVAVKKQESVGMLSSNPFESKQSFNDYYIMAQNLAKSDLVPQNYQNKPMNCMIALEQASRMNCSPLMVMQNLYIVRGRSSWSGQACAMLVQGCGLFDDVSLNYIGEKGKDTYGAYVSATRKSDGKEVVGTTVDMKMVKGEGWDSNPKWKTLTDQMLGYRAYTFFARLHCPAVLSGFRTEGEYEDEMASKKKNSNVVDPF